MALPFFPLVYGQVLTAGQWNALFNAKQDSLGYTPLNIAGGTMLGRLITAPSTDQLAGFVIQEGIAPTSPNDGDIWETSAGLFARINGVTYTVAGGGGGATNPILVKSANYTVLAGNVANGRVTILASNSITIIVPPSLGSAGGGPVVTVLNAGSGIITISDGSNTVDAIVTGAGANGQIGGYRNVVPNGTNSYSFGVG